MHIAKWQGTKPQESTSRLKNDDDATTAQRGARAKEERLSQHCIPPAARLLLGGSLVFTCVFEYTFYTINTAG